MLFLFFFQAEDGIRDLVRSRGLGDVYKRQTFTGTSNWRPDAPRARWVLLDSTKPSIVLVNSKSCLLYTSDAADERSSVDLGGRRIIKKKNTKRERGDDDSDMNSTQTHTQVA